MVGLQIASQSVVPPKPQAVYNAERVFFVLLLI
jgi:hypothetical protein